MYFPSNVNVIDTKDPFIRQKWMDTTVLAIKNCTMPSFRKTYSAAQIAAMQRERYQSHNKTKQQHAHENEDDGEYQQTEN